MYLYSMELGTPQLYAEAYRVARDMDLNYLKELGPYIKALDRITLYTELYTNTGDKVTPGDELGSITNNIGGSFLLFRGAHMKQE